MARKASKTIDIDNEGLPKIYVMSAARQWKLQYLNGNEGKSSPNERYLLSEDR